jgi:HK97 family phage prohead protease
MTDFINHWCKFELKAEGEAGESGVIEGYASVFDEKDLGSDIVVRGAYANTLRAKSAGRIPMLYGHDRARPPIGVWTEFREDQKGLFSRGWIDRASNDGGQLYRIIQKGAEFGISIGYRPVKHRFDAGRQARILEEIDLLEVSLTPLPMNESSRVETAKAASDLRGDEAFIRAINGWSEYLLKARASIDGK